MKPNVSRVPHLLDHQHVTPSPLSKPRPPFSKPLPLTETLPVPEQLVRYNTRYQERMRKAQSENTT